MSDSPDPSVSAAPVPDIADALSLAQAAFDAASTTYVATIHAAAKAHVATLAAQAEEAKCAKARADAQVVIDRANAAVHAAIGASESPATIAV